MDPVHVSGYSIRVEAGLRRRLPDLIRSVAGAARYVVITDDNVNKLYGDEILSLFKSQGLTTLLYAVAPGEASKSRATKAAIENWMLAQRCSRDTTVVALGGGVVGDLAGFVAATYMRGIPFVQVPTTLLACVDSSIGGKTGLDTDAGKNLIGAIYRPKAVFIDLEFLKTLPPRELSNGMAEVIKTGAIRDEQLFRFLETNAVEIMNRDSSVLTKMVHWAASIKAEVVKADEFEGGIRSILNFGHTIGHAVEALASPMLTHGECVAVGMVFEARMARTRGFLDSSAIRRLINCLHAFKLPTDLDARLRIDDLVEKMAVDKKNRGASATKSMVMLTSIGTVNTKPSYTSQVSNEELQILLSPAVSLLPGTNAQGEIAVPGSKSISNRVLLMAALGRGICRIRGLLHSEDTQVMLAALEKLGVKFGWENAGKVLVMHGSSGRLQTPSSSLYLANAGTASRFLTSAVTLVNGGHTELRGVKRMHERPIGDLRRALIAAGCSIELLGKNDSLPVRIAGSGGLPGGEIHLKASISSQFVSSLLISAPYAKKPVVLKLDGDIVSPTYIDMTVSLMKQFGVVVERPDPSTFVIPISVYSNPTDFLVEGDASSATYPLALAAITGGTVKVTNMGSASIQGDAQFASLLERMGCTVSRTATTTTVTGPRAPQTLRCVPQIDMSDMTDAFMTAAVLAAVAKGTMRIENIANQRVKECNRIEVMVTELTKLGVKCRELDTGLEIVGTNYSMASIGRPSRSPHGEPVLCHKDHRIAMSFGVMGAVVPNIIVTDKQCTDKTYPSFWDDIRRFLGLRLDPTIAKKFDAAAFAAAHNSTNSKAAAAAASANLADATIVVIGMRGAGKTGLAQHAARALGRPFADNDHLIEDQVGSIKTFIETKGWTEFRRVELEVFERAMRERPTGWVFALGGGIVETPEARRVLASLPLVVEVQRSIVDIEKYLLSDPTRPKFAVMPSEVWKRRQDLYQQSSNYEFFIRKSDDQWSKSQEDFVRFLKQIADIRHPTDVGATIDLGGANDSSYFLSLTCREVEEVLPHLATISRAADALELRVDLLQSTDIDFVKSQVATLRRHSRLPIIFTVRSRAEGGAFAGDEAEMAALLKLALRLGVEFIDVERQLSSLTKQTLFASRGNTKIIVSQHFPKSNGGTRDELLEKFKACHELGQADVVKLVVSASTVQDAISIFEAGAAFKSAAASSPLRVPGVIALAMGEHGKLSRVLNRTLTPVTHPALSRGVAAPGQLSVQEIEAARTKLGLSMARKFHIFGSPVKLSPSPNMHNTGFAHLHLPHKYSACDTTNIDLVKKTISAADFGGASVTIPLKQSVIPLLGSLSPSAKAIGAVNTIIRGDSGSLHGDNTDWIGIYRPLNKLLSERPQDLVKSSYAVLAGAGGTSRAAIYALQQLGFGDRILIYNRTESRARALSEEFGCRVLGDLRSSQAKKVSVMISTVPGSSNFEAPAWILNQEPIVFDVAYLPATTRLLAQAGNKRCDTVRGIDMIVEQGLAQFELWTRRTPPVDAIRSAVTRNYKALVSKL